MPPEADGWETACVPGRLAGAATVRSPAVGTRAPDAPEGVDPLGTAEETTSGEDGTPVP